MKKSIKLITALVLCALVAGLPLSAVKAEFSLADYDGEAVYVYEYTSEEVVMAQNESVRMYPGSLTKIMTVLVASDYMDASDVVTVTNTALNYVGYNSSTAGLVVDEVVTYTNLITASLLPSGNDAAIVLAIAAGKKILGEGEHTVKECYEAFIAKMNEKAQYLGMINTHFANPDGYGDENNYSTAYDMVLMGKEAVKHEDIVNTVAKMKVSTKSNAKSHSWKSTNMMYYDDLSKFSYSMSGANPYYDSRVTGMKTGYTDMGQKCFLFTAKDSEKSIIGVLMNVPDDDTTTVFKQAYNIITYIFDSTKLVPLVNDDNRAAKFTVSNRGLLESSNILTAYMQNDDMVLVENELVEGVTFDVTLADGIGEFKTNGRLKLFRDVQAGETVAYAAFKNGDTVIRTIPMIAVEGYVMSTWIDYAVLIVAVVFVIVAVTLIKKTLKLRKIKKRKQIRAQNRQ